MPTATAPTPYQSAGSVTNPQAQGGVTAPVATPTAPTISTINSTNTAPQTQINTASPYYTDPSTLTGAVNGGTALLAANNSTLTPATASTNPSDILSQLQSLMPTPPSASATYSALQANSGISTDQTQANAAQQALVDANGNLSGINAQLAGLTASQNAANIQEGSRQAPTFEISGAQAAQNKDYAIKAIPLQAQALAAQAQVASAQGQATLSQQILTQAQNQLNQVFQLQMTDANAQYNYQTNLIDKAITMATANQATQLAAIKAQTASNQSDVSNAISNAQSISKTAVTNGNAAIAAAIAQIPVPNVNSPTFAQDLQTYNTAVANLQATIPMKPTAAQQNSGNVPKTATQVQNAAVGTALSDAKSAIAQGADPNAVKQAFLAKYPADNAKWTAYFSDATAGTSATNPPVYPTPTPTTKSFNLFDPSTW